MEGGGGGAVEGGMFKFQIDSWLTFNKQILSSYKLHLLIVL